VAAVTVELRQQQQVTGADGLATLDYRLLEKGDGDISFTVRGVFGDFRQTVETNLGVNRQPRITISTDKPIYRPGQTLHVRALIFTPAGHALAGAPVSIPSAGEPGSAEILVNGRTAAARRSLRISRSGPE
jgi:uncharacterized protein YfaS (alpha-2-macroglobulin family)